MTTKKNAVRRRVWEIVEVAIDGDKASRRFDLAILTLIFLNVLAVVLESVQGFRERWALAFHVFEILSVVVFTAEYLLRLWSCVEDQRLQGKLLARLRYALRTMSLIDLVAILPFYLPFFGVDLRSVRVVRLLRLFRLAKLGRYSRSIIAIRDVCRDKREELVLTTVLMGFLLVIASSLLYDCENHAQPEVFSSIPATMWWAVATLTTVGYGDMYPVTSMGKAVAGVIAVLGIGMFALPTGILGAGFVEAVEKRKKAEEASGETCPHCGRASG